jgi:hypothetical protein
MKRCAGERFRHSRPSPHTMAAWLQRVHPPGSPSASEDRCWPAPLREQLLARVMEQLPDSCVRDRIRAMSEMGRTMPMIDVARRFGCSGYVAEAVPLAIFAASGSEGTPLVEALRRVIQLGGDTDTIAAMTGQILGAKLGSAHLPKGGSRTSETCRRLPRPSPNLRIKRSGYSAPAEAELRRIIRRGGGLVRRLLWMWLRRDPAAVFGDDRKFLLC